MRQQRGLQRGAGADFYPPFPFSFLSPDVGREQHTREPRLLPPVPTHGPTPRSAQLSTRGPREGDNDFERLTSSDSSAGGTALTEVDFGGQRREEREGLYPSAFLFSFPPPSACARGSAGAPRQTPGTEQRNSSTDLYTPPSKKNPK